MSAVLPVYLALDLHCEVPGFANSVQALLDRIRSSAERSATLRGNIRLGVVGLGAEVRQALSLVHLDSVPSVRLPRSEGPSDFQSGFAYLAELINHDVDFFKSNNVQVVRPLVIAVVGSGLDADGAATASMELSVSRYAPNVVSYGIAGAAAGPVTTLGTMASYLVDRPGDPDVRLVLDHIDLLVTGTADRFAAGTHSVMLPVAHPGLIAVRGG